MQKNEPPGKSRDRLKAAKLRKRGWVPDRIADIVEYAKSTVHGWLLRMQEEGPRAQARPQESGPAYTPLRRPDPGAGRHPAPEPDGRRL